MAISTETTSELEIMNRSIQIIGSIITYEGNAVTKLIDTANLDKLNTVLGKYADYLDSIIPEAS